MKVLIPLIKGNSGNDVYFQSLRDDLRKRDVFVEMRHFPHFFELWPPLAKAGMFLKSDVKSYTLIHTNADYGSYFKVAAKPLVVTVHHNIFEENYQRYTSPVQKAYHFFVLKKRISEALMSADGVVAVSLSTKVSLERTFGVSKAHVIYNGVDTDIFCPKELPSWSRFSDKIKLLFVGNLTRRKGADLLPRIMEKLGENYLLFYTSGLRAGKIFKHSNMIPLGTLSREELVEVYNRCDILLLPSRLEGFGYAVAEAMACGKPVVCTNGSSLPELLIDQKGGFLCEQDNVEDFVEKIRILAADRGLRESMGKFNRWRILETFTVQKMGESYLRLYRHVLETP